MRVAVAITFDADNMYVHLADDRIITVPLTAYKRLSEATPEQRLDYRIFGRGSSIRWDAIDEDLSVAGLLRDFGAKEPNAEYEKVQQLKEEQRRKDAFQRLRALREEVRSRNQDITTEEQAMQIADQFSRAVIDDLVNKGKVSFERE